MKKLGADFCFTPSRLSSKGLRTGHPIFSREVILPEGWILTLQGVVTMLAEAEEQMKTLLE